MYETSEWLSMEHLKGNLGPNLVSVAFYYECEESLKDEEMANKIRSNESNFITSSFTNVNLFQLHSRLFWIILKLVFISIRRCPGFKARGFLRIHPQMWKRTTDLLL